MFKVVVILGRGREDLTGKGVEHLDDLRDSGNVLSCVVSTWLFTVFNVS